MKQNNTHVSYYEDMMRRYGIVMFYNEQIWVTPTESGSLSNTAQHLFSL